MKNEEKKIAYSEPLDYFPEETRKKFKLGEYAEEKTIFEYRSYYEYDFEQEAIYVAEGDESSEAYNLYRKMAMECCPEIEGKWAFDIALDCVRNFTDEECALIREQGEIPFFHFGYGVTVRNKYVYPSKKHTYFMADDVSSTVEKFIYAILCPEAEEKV
jgi:hypothetical protein